MPACVGGHIVKMFIVATVVNIFVSGTLIFIIKGFFFHILIPSLEAT